MARIVLGMAASHGPLLATPPEQWDERVEADKRNPALIYRDGTFKFDELARLRASENLEDQIRLPVKQQRYDACQRAMAEMARVFKEAKPDVAILVGNDQMEVFEDDNIPAFMVCFGETRRQHPVHPRSRRSACRPASRSPSRTITARPPRPIPAIPGSAAISSRSWCSAISTWRHRRGCRSPRPPTFPVCRTPTASSIAASCRRISFPRCRSSSTPSIRPTSRACGAASRSERRSPKPIASWEGDLRVAVIGSGGMSHFVVDEELDRRFLDAMKRKDADALLSIPPYNFRSGTSELKNWIPVAGAMKEVGLDMTVIDYQPLYRSVGRHRQRHGLRLLAVMRNVGDFLQAPGDRRLRVHARSSERGARGRPCSTDRGRLPCLSGARPTLGRLHVLQSKGGHRR